MTKRSLHTQISIKIAAVFLVIGLALIFTVYRTLHDNALRDARVRADIMLNHNLAVHTYSTHQLKPHLFEHIDPDEAFDPVLMSSTYAVREIHSYFGELHKNGEYYYKECAIDARNPSNEADEMERAFIRALNEGTGPESYSGIREIDGSRYYVLMKKGEIMEEMCLACHGAPDRAPAEVVAGYGAERSFGRNVGDVVSAVSIRIPVSDALHAANTVTARLAVVLVLGLTLLFAVQYRTHRKQVIEPLLSLRERALRIAERPETFRDNLELPAAREIAELTGAFNTMHDRIQQYQNDLEGMVEERTEELKEANSRLTQALDEIKTLHGIIPICSYCKKVRTEEGLWNQLEKYISSHSDAKFSHGICPQCLKKFEDGKLR